MECQSSSSKVAQQTSRRIFKEKISWLDRIANYNDTFKWYKSKTMQLLTKKKKKRKQKKKRKSKIYESHLKCKQVYCFTIYITEI